MLTETCERLLDGLSNYLDGELPAELRAEVERHLATCENCRAVVDTTRKTLLLYHGMPQPGLSPDARERLYKSLDLSAYLPPDK
jgi:anti-sigma factor RsiW